MANSIVVKDIGALDQFASQLSQAKTALEQARGQIKSALNQVSGQWQDPQREKCAQEIERLSAQISKFSQAAEQQISYCRRLASHLRNTPH